MKIYIAFHKGLLPQHNEESFSWACRAIGEDGTVKGELYGDAGPMLGDKAHLGLTLCTLEAVSIMNKAPLEEPVSIYVHKDEFGYGEYVINRMKNMGRWFVSGGRALNGEPILHWEHWKKVAEVCMSRDQEPQWSYAPREANTNIVVNLSRKLLRPLKARTPGLSELLMI